MDVTGRMWGSQRGLVKFGADGLDGRRNRVMMIDVGDATMLLNDKSDGMDEAMENDDDGLQKRPYLKLRHRCRWYFDHVHFAFGVEQHRSCF